MLVFLPCACTLLYIEESKILFCTDFKLSTGILIGLPKDLTFKTV